MLQSQSEGEKQKICTKENPVKESWTAKLPAEEKNLLEVWFAQVLAGKFNEEQQEFIRKCFRGGDGEMISGFQQIMDKKEAAAEKRGQKLGQKQGIQIGREQGVQIGIRILVKNLRELGQPQEKILKTICRDYGLSKEEAQRLLQECLQD